MKYGLVFIVVIAILLATTAQAWAGGGDGGIGIHPAYFDLGRINPGNPHNLAVIVNNGTGKPREMAVEVQGQGAEWISISDNNFTLNPGEERRVTINIHVPPDAAPGPYDLSIIFKGMPKGETGVVMVPAANLRLKFIIPGVRIASFAAPNVEKPNVVDLVVILANFYETVLQAQVSMEIVNESGAVLSTFNGEKSIDPYPEKFYSSFRFPWETHDVEMGNYVARATATFNPINDTKLIAEKAFTVGWMKGEILSVAVNDATQGEPVYFIAKIGNIGNLPLPVLFKLIVKDKDGMIILDLEKKAEIAPLVTEEVILDWDTSFPNRAPAGKYTALFDIDYGHDNYQAQAIFEVKRLLPPLYIIAIISLGALAIASLAIYLIRRRLRLKKALSG